MNNLPFVQKYSDIFNLADTFQYSAQLFFAYSEGIFEILVNELSSIWIIAKSLFLSETTTFALYDVEKLPLIPYLDYPQKLP